jgi:peptide/nickel transport system permease protein
MVYSATQRFSQGLRAIAVSEMTGYVIKRLLQAIVTLLLASALSFAIIQFAPGDYLDTLKANPKISPERVEELRRQFGLDRPAIEQYGRWLWQVISRGNFGTSFVYQRSVASLLWERVPATLLLAIASIIVTWGVAIPLGTLVLSIKTAALTSFCRCSAISGRAFLVL